MSIWSRQDCIIWIKRACICFIIDENLTGSSDTCKFGQSSREFLTAWLILGKSSNLSVCMARMTCSILLRPPRLAADARSLKHIMKACGFYFRTMAVRKVSLHVLVALWAWLMIKPVIINGLTFLQSRSRTSCLYVTTNTPPKQNYGSVKFKNQV